MLIRFWLILSSSLLLVACGQKGPLKVEPQALSSQTTNATTQDIDKPQKPQSSAKFTQKETEQ
ncbi:LPS translocon maturation chaperone LptM [Aliikangiella sp. IMCC44632]